MQDPWQRRRVADVMTAHVHVISPSTPFKTIVRLMEDNHVSGVPVVDTMGEVVGLVSEADLLLKEESAVLSEHGWLETRQHRAERAKSAGAIAVDLMTSPVISIGPGAGVAEAARLMHERGVKRLVVVDAAGHLAGIVSRADLLKVFMRADEEIRQEVTEGLATRTLWLDVDRLEVEVSNGVVTLKGALPRRSDVEILASMTQRVDGVVAVRTELEYEWDDRKAERVAVPSLLPDLATGPARD